MSREAWGAILALVAVFILTSGILLGRQSYECPEPVKVGNVPVRLSIPPDHFPAQLKVKDLDGVERTFRFACRGETQ